MEAPSPPDIAQCIIRTPLQRDLAQQVRALSFCYKKKKFGLQRAVCTLLAARSTRGERGKHMLSSKFTY